MPRARNRGDSPIYRKRKLETGLAGWGARTRTWEWRNQNPLPYHLATPQCAEGWRVRYSGGAGRDQLAS